MNQASARVESFLSGIDSSAELWQSIDLRVVAGRVDNRWYNLVTRVTLNSAAPSEILRLRHLPHTDHLLVKQEVFESNVLAALINQVLAGSVTVGGVAIDYRTGRGSDAMDQLYSDVGYSRANITFDEDRSIFNSGYRLTIRGDDAGQILYQYPDGSAFLDAALRNLERPWDGMNAVTLYAAGVRQALDGTSTLRAEFIGPVEATLDAENTTLREGELTYSVIVGSRAVRDRCTLGIFGTLTSGQIVSESLALKNKRWRKHANGYVHTSKSRFRNVHQLTLILRVGNFDLEPVRLANRPRSLPPLANAFAVLDPGLKRFTNLLFAQDGSKSREFERAVNRLFRFAGFVCDDLTDNPRGADTVDGFAFEPQSRVFLIIECTTGALNQDGKLGKLFKRASELRTRITAEPGITVVPVIVTFLNRNDLLDSEVEVAREQRIRILTREDLEQMLELVFNHSPVEKFVEFFYRQPSFLWRNIDRNPLAD